MALGTTRFKVCAGKLALAAALTLAVLGCSGDNGDDSHRVPLPTITPTVAPLTAPAAISPAAEIETPANAVATTEAPVVADDLDLIYQVALERIDGVLVSRPSDCATSERSCVVALATLPASAAEGIVMVGGMDPGGAGAGWIILGKRADGSWGVFMIVNNLMPPNTPSMEHARPVGFVCNAPDGLNVRSGPGMHAGILGVASNGTAVEIERFVLETESSNAGVGSGWYEISSPVAGWVNSNFLSIDPALLNCLGDYGANRR